MEWLRGNSHPGPARCRVFAAAAGPPRTSAPRRRPRRGRAAGRWSAPPARCGTPRLRPPGRAPSPLPTRSFAPPRRLPLGPRRLGRRPASGPAAAAAPPPPRRTRPRAARRAAAACPSGPARAASPISSSRSAPACGMPGVVSRAVSARTAIMEMWCATTSCSSRTIRARSPRARCSVSVWVSTVRASSSPVCERPARTAIPAPAAIGTPEASSTAQASLDASAISRNGTPRATATYGPCSQRRGAGAFSAGHSARRASLPGGTPRATRRSPGDGGQLEPRQRHDGRRGGAHRGRQRPQGGERHRRRQRQQAQRQRGLHYLRVSRRGMHPRCW